MAAAGKRKVWGLRAVGILFILLFALLYSHEEVGMSGNEAGRFATIQAVGEQGTFAIEKSNFRSVDRTVRGGHIYYDKLPAIAWSLGMIHRAVYRNLGWNFVDQYHWLIYLYNFFAGAAVNVLFFWWLFNFFRSVRRGGIGLKFLLALGGVFGTLMLSYSTMVNNHTPAALAVLGVFIALRKFQKKPAFPAAMLAGLAAGCAGLAELPSGFFFGLAAVIGISLASPSDKRWKYAFCTAAGGLVCVLAGAALNFYAYGSILPLYMSSGGGKGTFSIVAQRSAVDYWFHALAGDKGLFSYTPFFLLALPGFLKLWQERAFRKGEAVLLGGICCFALFYLICTCEFGGWCYAFRYFIPLAGIFWCYAGMWLLNSSRSNWKFAAAAILGVWGIATAWAGAYCPFCIGHEGRNTPPGHFTENICSFGGNLLCWAYENNPHSAFTRLLIDRYGRHTAGMYLYWSFFQLKKMPRLESLKSDFPELFKKK